MAPAISLHAPDAVIEANTLPTAENFSSALTFWVSCEKESGCNTFILNQKAMVRTSYIHETT